MEPRKLLLDQIGREQRFCDAQEVGSEAYVASLERLVKLEKELAALDKTETEFSIKQKEMKGTKVDRAIKNGIEIGKIAVTGVAMPYILTKIVVELEKEGYTFTSMCKTVINSFINKKS